MVSEPSLIPQNFRLDRIIDARSAQFSWDPIVDFQEYGPRSGLTGKLPGILIQFYTTNGNINSLTELKNHKVEGNVTSTIIPNLPPYSTVRLRIAVLNERYQGDFSVPISIQTLEGVPGPVVNLRGKPYGSSGVKLEWEEPEEPNGIIIGYQIQFQQITK